MKRKLICDKKKKLWTRRKYFCIFCKNENTSKYEYKGYGICFDESESFSHVRKEGNFNHNTLARNVIIFGVNMSFSKHANNKANNIYVMSKDYITKINDTTIYAEKMFYRNST